MILFKKKILNSVFFSIGANFSTLLVSLTLLIMLPKVIGVQGFGYWQLYLLFTTYTALLHFGWVDGVYLKYGGKKYIDLDKKLLSSQFIMLTLILCIITFLSTFIIFESDLNFNKKIIFISVFFSALFVIPRGFLLMILQATDRIKEYSKLTIYSSVIFIIMLVNLFIFEVNEFYIFIIADIFAKLISLLITMYACKDLFFKMNFKHLQSNNLKNEVLDNIKIGINIAIAYVAGVLVIGIVRQGVEIQAGIIEFSNLSLSLNFVNVILIFVNALAVVFFPIIKRSNNIQRKKYYLDLNKKISDLLYLLFLFYYPFLLIIEYLFPDFGKSATIFYLIFPIILLEGKNSILNIVYLKSLRKEKTFLIINIILVVFSVILTYIVILKLNFYNYAPLIIVFILLLKYVSLTTVISKAITVKISFSIFKDVFVILTFILINNQLSFNLSFFVMFLILIFNLILSIISKNKNA